MKLNRRDWLKTTLLGTAALSLSPLEFLARQTPHFDTLSKNPETIRLCFNENPFGASPLALEAMQENLRLSSMYDFRFADTLAEKLAEINQVKKEQILVSAGSSFLLELIIKYISIHNGHFITPDPSFTIFSPIGKFLGMTETTVPLTAQKRIDLATMKKAIKPDTKLIYICNPNNPTGDVITRKEVEAFIQTIPSEIIILVDEAYIEFTQEKSLAELTSRYHNLIVTRTFSKLYGFAGARLGYAIAHKTLMSQLKQLQSWSGAEISVVTMAGALAAVEDKAFTQKVLANNQETKEYLYTAFQKNDIPYIPSSTNFVYFSLENYKADYFQKLKDSKILGGKTYEEKGKWTRISLGTMDEMKRYTQAIF